MTLEHFALANEWWDDRKEITIDGFDKAKKYTVEDILQGIIILIFVDIPTRKKKFCRLRS